MSSSRPNRRYRKSRTQAGSTKMPGDLWTTSTGDRGLAASPAGQGSSPGSSTVRFPAAINSWPAGESAGDHEGAVAGSKQRGLGYISEAAGAIPGQYVEPRNSLGDGRGLGTCRSIERRPRLPVVKAPAQTILRRWFRGRPRAPLDQRAELALPHEENASATCPLSRGCAGLAEGFETSSRAAEPGEVSRHRALPERIGASRLNPQMVQ
jgi:hypothetical protein